MNSADFFQLAKRNIFHSFMKCNEQSDPKYIPNYAPSVIAEFNDNHLIIKDFNTRKDLYLCQYEEINSVSLSICTRLITMKFVPAMILSM